MRFGAALGLLMGLGLTACGKEEEPTPPPPLVDADNNRNNEEDMGMFDPDEECSRLDDLGEGPGELLEQPFDSTRSIEELSCVGNFADAEADGAWTAKLEFAREVYVTITIDGLPKATDMLVFPPAPVWELREARCSSGQSLTCTNERSESFLLKPDTPYYLVVNGRLDSGGVQAQFLVEDLVCQAGQDVCEDGVLRECNANGTEESTVECIGDCFSANACGGDECQQAAELTLTPNGASEVITGNRSAYSDTWNSDGLDGCNPYEPGPAGPSPGSEFFIRFKDLRAGQTLVFDAEESDGNMAFYVSTECLPTTCEAAYAFDASNFNRGEHPVAADGDLLVAFEALGNDDDRDFTVEVSLQE